MMTLRPADERGQRNIGWLNAKYTFSFANYYDEKWMGFRALRVINDDVVSPGRGFGWHPHDNMEIMTWMIEGSLGHTDSTGVSAALSSGELQYMSAGTGVHHSEQNASRDQASHSIQIWLLPNVRNEAPRYEQKVFLHDGNRNKLVVMASTDGRHESIAVKSDAELLAARLDAGRSLKHEFRLGHGWLQVTAGSVTVRGETMRAGDGVAIRWEESVEISGVTDCEFLLFDLA